MKAMNAKGVTSGPEATTNRQFNNGNKNMSTDLDLECIYVDNIFEKFMFMQYRIYPYPSFSFFHFHPPSYHHQHIRTSDF